MIRTHELKSYGTAPLKVREWVVGYARVSSSRQGSEKGFGLATQKKAIQDYCRTHSLALHDIYTDIASGVEAKMEERTAYFEMLSYAKQAGISKVVVFDVNRLFRDPASCVLVKKDFAKLSLDIRSSNQPTYSIYNEDDPSEYLVNSLLESLSHYDRLVITSKLRAGRNEKAKQGRYCGGGISTGVTIQNREMIVNENEMQTVRLIFRLKKRKLTPYRIALILNEKGIKGKNSGQWFPSSVTRILRNKIYKGLLKHGSNYYPSCLGKIL